MMLDIYFLQIISARYTGQDIVGYEFPFLYLRHPTNYVYSYIKI